MRAGWSGEHGTRSLLRLTLTAARARSAFAQDVPAPSIRIGITITSARRAARVGRYPPPSPWKLEHAMSQTVNRVMVQDWLLLVTAIALILLSIATTFFL
jgi:hypothetical protein